MKSQDTQKLAEKIALLLQSEEKREDSGFLLESLEKINQRLDKIESQLNPHSAFHIPQFAHPSQEKFKMIDELVDEIIANQAGGKPCIFEAKKPCDNCSMCNSRGF